MMSDNIFNMSVDFLKAMTSRGILNRKIEIPLKQLRVLSCFGNNKDIPPCEYLKNSSTEGKMICGKCGCGDKKITWLLSDDGSYSKLDYPSLTCPINMPGFSNYESTIEKHPPTRKLLIENLSEEEISKVVVTVNKEE